MTVTDGLGVEVRQCPFPDCDWSREYDSDDEYDDYYSENLAELHYEEEHAGKVRVQVTVEKEQQIGDRDPADIRERLLEEFSVPGFDIAHVRTELLEEADDHSQLEVEA